MATSIFRLFAILTVSASLFAAITLNSRAEDSKLKPKKKRVSSMSASVQKEVEVTAEDMKTYVVNTPLNTSQKSAFCTAIFYFTPLGEQDKMIVLYRDLEVKPGEKLIRALVIDDSAKFGPKYFKPGFHVVGKCWEEAPDATEKKSVDATVESETGLAQKSHGSTVTKPGATTRSGAKSTH